MYLKQYPLMLPKKIFKMRGTFCCVSNESGDSNLKIYALCSFNYYDSFSYYEIKQTDSKVLNLSPLDILYALRTKFLGG